MYLAEKGYSVTCIDRNLAEGQETSYMNGGLMCPSLTYPWANVGTLKKIIYEMAVSTIKGTKEKRCINVDKKLLLSPAFAAFGLSFAWNALNIDKFYKNYTASYQLATLSQRCLEKLDCLPEQICKGSLQLFSSTADRDEYFSVQSRVIPHTHVLSHPAYSAQIIESSLSDHTRFKGGFVHSDLDRTMDSFKLCRVLRRRAEGLGVTFILGRTVESFSTTTTTTIATTPHPHPTTTAATASIATATTATATTTTATTTATASPAALSISSLILDDGSTVAADIYIAANGNDSNIIAEWAGDGRHSWPIRGYVLDTPTSPAFQPLQHAIVDDVRKVYIAPLGLRRVRISGLCDVSVLSAPPNVSAGELSEKCTQLMGQARALMPENFFIQPTSVLLQNDHSGVLPASSITPPPTTPPTTTSTSTSTTATRTATTATVGVDSNTAVFHTCQRPQTADDLPVIGQSSKIKNLYYNSGHGHLGLTRGLGSAKILTKIIVDDRHGPSDTRYGPADATTTHGIDISLFKPSRFKIL
jgi:glycine/D-amino acid oxidase-like deaminating enzyme